MNLLLGMLLCVGTMNPLVDAADPEPVAVLAGQTVELTVPVTVADGYHVQAQPADNPFLVPLELLGDAGDGLSLISVEYPIGIPDPTGEGHAEPLAYVGAIELRVTLQVAADATPGPHALRAQLRYQACSSNRCFAPDSLAVELMVQVAESCVTVSSVR